MSSLAELAADMWGGLLASRGGRFDEKGWSYDESLTSGCPSCGGELHIFGKPYETAKGEYRFAAYVCPVCNVVLSHNDVGVRSRADLRRTLDRQGQLVLAASPSIATADRPRGDIWSICELETEVPGGEAAARLKAELNGAELPASAWELEHLTGPVGNVWALTVRHQQLLTGCQATEVVLSDDAGEKRNRLHMTVRRCTESHEAGVGVAVGVLLAAALDVTVDGYAPWRVGRTTRETVGALVSFVSDTGRQVPIVAVSGPFADARATSLRDKLCGSALVTTVDSDAAWEISARLGASQSCYAGAARIYPAMSHRSESDAVPVWVSRRIAQQGWDVTEREISATVLALNPAVSRPSLEAELRREEARKIATQSTAKIRELEALLRSSEEREIQSDPTIDEIFEQLTSDNDVLNELLGESESANRDLEDRLAAMISERDLVLTKLNHARWAETPDDAQPSVVALDANVEDAITRLADPKYPLVCTENALRVWRGSQYPDDERMLHAVRQLEHAADLWRAAGCQVGGRLEDWIYETAQLRYAPSDKGLKQAGQDEFVFEDRNWSRVPHIKVDDAKHANQVGRIYFAIDTKNQRWIVDHVGQKLYGR